MNRAERRHRNETRKAKYKKMIRIFGRSEDPRYVGQSVNTWTSCSCAQCGNQRRHEGLTIQELKHNQSHEL